MHFILLEYNILLFHTSNFGNSMQGLFCKELENFTALSSAELEFLAGEDIVDIIPTLNL